MRKFTGIAMLTALAALAAWSFSSTAQARMNEDECAEQVAQECGPMPLTKCFDDQSMWDKIAPECTSYVQTNLENANDANQ